MAEFLTEEVGIAQTRSIRYAEKLHLKERENYGDYLNQSIYDRLGGARDDLEFEWRLALVFDEDANFKSFINKFGVDKADEVWRFCQSQKYTDNQLAEVFKYFGQSTNNNVEDILFLFSSGKGRIASLLDDAFRAGKEADLGKVLLNDLEKGSAEFVSYLTGKGGEGVKLWEVLIAAPDWARLNTHILELGAKEPNDVIRKKFGDFYATTMKNQTPAGFVGGEKIYGGVWYNKYGFPDFEILNQTIGKKYNYPNAKGNYSSDFTDARDWLKNQSGIEGIDDYNGTGSPLI